MRKETPRQRMINMIYLVLTALLALNVSSTVLDKFAFINQSLEQANSETSSRNGQTLSGMQQLVEEKGNRTEDLEVITAAEQIRTQTQEIMAYLEESKDTFIEITGGYEEGHDGDNMHIRGKTDYDKIGHYMMSNEEGGDGYGIKMKEKLNGYAEFLRELLRQYGANEEELAQYYKLARDANEDVYYSKDPNQQGKKWSTLSFNNSPTHAALATVSEFQANVLRYETTALDFLKRRVGLKDLTFDEIKPVVMPQSQYVVTGAKYRADMFIAASASRLDDQIQMSYNGVDIPITDGIGKVEFTATPGTYDQEGNAKKSFEAAITIPLGGGLDTTFKSTIEYFVVKPVIQIQSQSVNALYLGCGNMLDVQVPALGNAYNPSFRAQGGDAIKGSARGQVTVVPNSRKVVLTVSSNGNIIGSREFGVRAIPAPNIRVSTDQGEVNMKEGIPAKTPRLYLKAEPDRSFAEFLPNDAKFRVFEVEVTLVSGGLGRGSIRAGGQVDLSQITRNARKGDQIVIEIRRVQRQNFRKQVEDFAQYQRYVNITLK